jgi:hypothetical protein
MLATKLTRSIAKNSTSSRIASSLRQNNTAIRRPQLISSSYYSSSKQPLSTYATNSESRNHHSIPEPLPALAYAYDYHDYDDHEEDDYAVRVEENETYYEVVEINNINNALTMEGDVTFVKATNKPSLAYPNIPNYDIPTRKFSGMDGGGGGGGGSGGPPSGNGGGGGGGKGRHKCPKCGMSITFKHGDFEENTFYCATCSGWFLVKKANEKATTSSNSTESSVAAAASFSSTGGSAYDEFKEEKTGNEIKPRKVTRQQILMTHVSDYKF